VNPIPGDGQICFDKTNKIFKVGDGVTAYNTLATAGGGGGSSVLTTVLTGLSLASSAVIAATDTILAAFGQLQAQITLRAPITSPTFLGTPAAPTAAPSTNTTQLATTAFVTTADNLKANIAGPTFTGVPAAPTAAPGTNTTQIATTAYVDTADALKANLASPTFTGTPAAPTAAPSTNTTQIASTAFVTAAVGAIIAAADAMVYKGGIACAANPNYPAADTGHLYKVTSAGRIGGASGVVVEIGDTIMCQTDSTASGDQATVGAQWNVTQTNIDGAVVGPSAVTSGNPAVFSGASGKVIAEATFAAFKTSLAITTADIGGLAAAYQPLGASLTAIQALALTNDNFMQVKGGAWTGRTIAQVKTDLSLTGTNSGDQTVTLTGSITGSGTGTFATTITSGAVALSHMANLPTLTLIGNNTGGSAVPAALTVDQVNAMLPAFTSALAGLVPASGGGTVLYLRADGTWAVPGGGGGGVSPGQVMAYSSLRI
jgi:hypothetical protein